MADYTNLTSLEGLQVGDIITYNTTTTIDFKGCKVKVELYGDKIGNGNGGYTSFIIDTILLPSQILTFNNSNATVGGQRNDLIYGNTDSLYYRIAVAGNGGGNAHIVVTSPTGLGGAGGGLTGARAQGSTSQPSPGYGGTQTSGGSGYNAGKFG